jgi:putative salt-induced outer membrane protein YdiY
MLLARLLSGLALVALTASALAQDPPSPPPPPPDEVFLKNGDKLTGKILHLRGGTLTIDTPYAGKVDVKWEEVASFNAPGIIDIQLKSGEFVNSPASRGEAGTVKVPPSALAQEQIALASIEKINPAPITWTGNIAAGMQFKRGNVDEDSSIATALAQRETDIDRITGRGRYSGTRVKDQATDDWATTDRYIGALLQYDYFIVKDWFLYVNGQGERDRAKFLDVRWTAGVGAGWQFLNDADVKGSVEAGVNFISEKYKLYQNHPVPPGTTPPTIRSDEDFMAARVALNLDWKILENLRYLQFTQYFPSLEDKDKFLVNSQHTLQLSVTGNLFVQGGVIFDYDSQPGSNTAEKLDVKYLVQLGWSF